MTFSMDQINQMNEGDFKEHFLKLCGSQKWVQGVFERRPFLNLKQLIEVSSLVWFQLGRHDFLEAFAHHPRIGDRIESGALENQWASQEQSGAHAATSQVVKELKNFNHAYELKFKHVFLICATGKSAAEMLDSLKSRIQNSEATELQNAAVEQSKITSLRIKKLIGIN